MYLLVAFLCAYAGFAALCAITRRNVPLVWTTPPTRSVVTALRVAGYLLLALSWVPCYLNGFALVFPFAYAPKRTVQAGGVAALLAGMVWLVS
jgi:hypothetical protein